MGQVFHFFVKSSYKSLKFFVLNVVSFLQGGTTDVVYIGGVMQDKLSRAQSLDMLRGIAVLIVVVHHVGVETIPAIPELSGVSGFIFWKIKNLGWSGVDLFFILSGFLIGGLLLTEAEKFRSINVGRFLLRRGLKIWPSYLVLILVLAICEETNWISGESVGGFIRDIFVHVFYTQNYLDIGVNGPTWSLAVEEHFYLLLVLLFSALFFIPKVFTRNLQLLPYILIVVVLAILASRVVHVLNGNDLHNDFMMSHFRFDSLLMGVLLQYFYRYNKQYLRDLTSRYYYPIVIVSLLLISPSMFLSRNNAMMFSIGFSFLSLGYSLLVLLVVCHGFGRWESSRVAKPLGAVGCWSYNIYLWHFFIPLLLSPFYYPMQIYFSQFALPSEVILAVQATIYILLSIVCGYLMTRVVEMPFLALRSQWVPQGFKARVI